MNSTQKKTAWACAFALAVMFTTARAEIIWSASFESYTNGESVVINDTTVANDMFSGIDFFADSLTATNPAGTYGFDSGMAGVMEGTTAAKSINVKRGNLSMSDTVVISLDIADETGNVGNWLWGLSGACAALLNNNWTPDQTRLRISAVINRSATKITMPFDNSGGSWDTDSPDAVDASAAGVYHRYASGTYVYNPSAAGWDEALDQGPPFTELRIGGYSVSQPIRVMYDNFIISDSTNELFIAPDGAWRNIRELQPGTRPTSTFLTTNAASPSFAETFATAFSSNGTAASGAILDVGNTADMDDPGNNYGWLSFDSSVSTNEPIELLLDIDGPDQDAIDLVVRELDVDAGLRSYTFSTNDTRLTSYLGGNWDALLTLPAPNNSDFCWSWRFGGAGSIVLDRACVYVPPPAGTVVSIR